MSHGSEERYWSGVPQTIMDFISTVGQDYYHYHEDERIPFEIAYIGVLSFLTFFVIVHNVFHLFCFPPSTIKRDNSSHIADVKLQPIKNRFHTEYWKWKNLCISWLHALICSLWIISSFLFYPEFLDDLILHHNMSSYLLVCFSTGYFLYDFIDMWRLGLLKDHWEIALHHVAITSLMIWNLYDCQRIAWSIIALTAEINSFFLHSRKLLRISRVDERSFLYKVTISANLVSFVVCRFATISLILMATIFQSRRFTLTYWLCLIAMQVVMNGINPVLFWRLIKTDVLNPMSKRGPESSPAHDSSYLSNDCDVHSNGSGDGLLKDNGQSYPTEKHRTPLTNGALHSHEKTH